jgi:hypothetical protein
MKTVRRETSEDFFAETWRVQLSLKDTELVPAAVQVAILDQDPVPGFEARAVQLRRNARVKEVLRNSPLPAAERNALGRRSLSAASWNLGFREVSGDCVSLLTASDHPGMMVGSNSKGGKRWVVTKVTVVRGKPVCWCIQVNVARGRTVEVELTRRNRFHLLPRFERAVRRRN